MQEIFCSIFSLRKKILLFLRDEVKGSEWYEIFFSDENFIALLAFITDIFTQLNILNKNCNKRIKIYVNYSDILKLLRAYLHKNAPTHFPSCQTLPEEGKSIECSAFAEILDNLRNFMTDSPNLIQWKSKLNSSITLWK